MTDTDLPEQSFEGNIWVDNIIRSCPVLYFHFFWGICVIILGWTTLLSRYIITLKPYHRSMGQIWIYGMIIQLYSSTYSRNDGFRWFIFMFGLVCYTGMVIGHFMIRKYQRKETKVADEETIMSEQKDYEYLKKLHAGFMIASLVMVTGAGIMFSRRFVKTMECRNIFSPL